VEEKVGSAFREDSRGRGGGLDRTDAAREGVTRPSALELPVGCGHDEDHGTNGNPE
jgi:hypothetical protein